MNTNALVDQLCDLAQLDIDAVHACEQASKSIGHDRVLSNVNGMRDAHMRHIDNLSVTIKQLGGEPPEATKDLKGFFMKGYTSLLSLAGTMGALQAMKTNENLVTKSYEKVLQEKELPVDIRTVLEENFSDVKRHLRYIDSALATEEWKL